MHDLAADLPEMNMAWASRMVLLLGLMSIG